MPGYDDPLNALLLPASDLAKKIRSGERKSKPRDKLLAGALLVLLAERETMRWLYEAAREEARHRTDYANRCREELTPAALDRVDGYFRLKLRTGVVSDKRENS